MRDPDLSHITWRKSRRSTANGANCVEVGDGTDLVLLRDSRNPSGPVLAFSPNAWNSFLYGVRCRTFDIS